MPLSDFERSIQDTFLIHFNLQQAVDSPVRVHAITAHTSVRVRSCGEDVNQDWSPAEALGRCVSALVSGRLPGVHEALHELRNRDHVAKLLQRVSSAS